MKNIFKNIFGGGKSELQKAQDNLDKAQKVLAEQNKKLCDMQDMLDGIYAKYTR